jgi:hypothetical protein
MRGCIIRYFPPGPRGRTSRLEVLSLSDYTSLLLFIWRFVWGLYERAHIIRYILRPHLAPHGLDEHPELHLPPRADVKGLGLVAAQDLGGDVV